MKMTGDGWTAENSLKRKGVYLSYGNLTNDLTPYIVANCFYIGL